MLQEMWEERDDDRSRQLRLSIREEKLLFGGGVGSCTGFQPSVALLSNLGVWRVCSDDGDGLSIECFPQGGNDGLRQGFTLGGGAEDMIGYSNARDDFHIG